MMNINDIEAILPHRYPFLLVDKVLEVEKGKRIVAIKNVTRNEPFFNGHFPGSPVMPGVLIVEAMAQAAGLMMLEKGEADDKIVVFMGIDKARFKNPVMPGDTMRIEIDVIRPGKKVLVATGKAIVDDKVCATAEIMAGVADREKVG